MSNKQETLEIIEKIYNSLGINKENIDQEIKVCSNCPRKCIIYSKCVICLTKELSEILDNDFHAQRFLLAVSELAKAKTTILWLVSGNKI